MPDEDPSWRGPAAGGDGRRVLGAAEAFLRAILAGNQREALVVAADAYDRGILHFYEEVVEAAMEQVGRLWQQGRISVADEHLATAVVEATIASIYPRFTWPVSGPSAIVACVAPERHQLGARMVADSLAVDGWRTVFLGGDVPLDAAVEMAQRRRPALVGLSATLPDHVPAVEAAIEALRGAVPGVRVLVGGRGVRALHDPTVLGADACAFSCAEAVRAARPWKR
jgi:methanogenic corrinoid protein MtbC1